MPKREKLWTCYPVICWPVAKGTTRIIAVGLWHFFVCYREQYISQKRNSLPAFSWFRKPVDRNVNLYRRDNFRCERNCFLTAVLTNIRHFKWKYTPILINKVHLLWKNKVSGCLRKGTGDNIWI